MNMIAEFASRLLPPHEARRVLGGDYTEALHAALLEQLKGLRGAALRDVRSPQPLSKWRLERVCRHIDSHIDQANSLPSMAAIAGVSRMHFAAQFRAATGLRPHDYLLRRRIAVAKSLLADPARPIVDVALQVGFQSQSHFTTVFKRHLGLPPSRWRRQQHDIAAEAFT